ncbi:MAG: peroxide stress protein YaaA [Lachnospiraceae bacterium]|nr:peroxide stress protein YaaA [Lachnospiraceae bacterium]
MKIVISPAKQMVSNTDILDICGMPVFLSQAEEILDYLRQLSYEEAKKLWACNDKLARLNYERLFCMDLHRSLTPAILSYDGLAFKYMAPRVFEYGQFDYVQENLRILSGFYGVLKPLDGVTPYRLEMQARAKVGGTKDLYEYWGSRLYREVLDESRLLINLASKEYSRCLAKYLTPDETVVTCVFGELEKGKVVQKGVYAKMARGEMVRFMAERNIETPEKMKEFDWLGYRFDPGRSDEGNYIFIREREGTHGLRLPDH